MLLNFMRLTLCGEAMMECAAIYCWPPTCLNVTRFLLKTRQTWSLTEQLDWFAYRRPMRSDLILNYKILSNWLQKIRMVIHQKLVQKHDRILFDWAHTRDGFTPFATKLTNPGRSYVVPGPNGQTRRIKRWTYTRIRNFACFLLYQERMQDRCQSFCVLDSFRKAVKHCHICLI